MQYSRIFMAMGALILTSPLLAAPAQTPVQIELSHQLDEERADRIEPLIADFNTQQKDVQLKLVRRVDGEPPKHLNLVTREEYSRFVANKAQFKPLSDVMREAKVSFDAGKIAPELLVNLGDAKGKLFALPLAFSTPVLFINKDAFRKQGLDPEAPTKTWAQTQEVAGKFADVGNKCPFTTSWPALVHIDNMSIRNNGQIADASGKLAFNGLVQIKHIAMLATWYKSKYFVYFGRRDEADRRFANGECAMLTSNASLYNTLSDNKSFEVGVAPLPYHDDVQGTPQNTLADGASLWVAAGLKPAEIKGVAKFVNYVLGPEIQTKMTLAGGFLPITPVARAAASSTLLKGDLAGLQVALSQLQGKPMMPTVRVSQVEAARVILEEELEAVWANKKPAKEALDTAVQRGNSAMIPVAATKSESKAKAKKPKK